VNLGKTGMATTGLMKKKIRLQRGRRLAGKLALEENGI